MKWLFSFTLFEGFYMIQAIEVNKIHLLLDVSGTSIIALAGLPAGRLWPAHIYFFHKYQHSFVHTHSFLFISAFFIFLDALQFSCCCLLSRLLVYCWFLNLSKFVFLDIFSFFRNWCFVCRSGFENNKLLRIFSVAWQKNFYKSYRCLTFSCYVYFN